MAEIQAFAAAHEDELFEADYRAMLEIQLTGKKPREYGGQGVEGVGWQRVR